MPFNLNETAWHLLIF